MTSSGFGLVLLAALLHATWNAIVKSAPDKSMTTALVTGSAAVLSAGILPFIPTPNSGSWPFIAVSVIFHIVYFILVAQTYRVADMSATYPLMRGSAPVLVAISSVALLEQSLTFPAWLGIALICTGIFAMAIRRGAMQGAGILLALLNAAVIAGYTLIDGIGVRKSGAAAAYTLWIFMAAGIPLTSWAWFRHRNDLVQYAGVHWKLGLAGGFGTLASYGLVLWAMTVAPIAVVAALRETAIVFAVAISALVLRERVDSRRMVSALLIAAGAMALRLA